MMKNPAKSASMPKPDRARVTSESALRGFSIAGRSMDVSQLSHQSVPREVRSQGYQRPRPSDRAEPELGKNEDRNDLRDHPNQRVSQYLARLPLCNHDRFDEAVPVEQKGA